MLLALWYNDITMWEGIDIQLNLLITYMGSLPAMRESKIHLMERKERVFFNRLFNLFVSFWVFQWVQKVRVTSGLDLLSRSPPLGPSVRKIQPPP